VHWLVIAALFTFASGAINASEPVAESIPVMEVASSIVTYDLPPAYSPGAASSIALNTASQLKPVAKLKVAKKSKHKKSMLSRTERNQMALLVVKQRPQTALSLAFLNDEDVESGADDLDLHRSLSRPKVARTFDQDDEEDIEVSDHVKVRLFLARMKAVQAHQKRFS
jgi:hypothetical protein